MKGGVYRMLTLHGGRFYRQLAFPVDHDPSDDGLGGQSCRAEQRK